MGDADDFPMHIGLHQWSSLSPFLFTMVLDELTRRILDEVRLCMPFANGIVLKRRD